MSKSKVYTKLYYAAPEALLGYYDSSSDVWNLGMLIYILFFGTFPFFFESEESIKEVITEKKIEFPVNHPMSPNARAFLLKILLFNERPTVENCLAHEWFSYKEETTGDEKYDEILNKLSLTLKRLKEIKSEKPVKSKFSVVSDVLFDKQVVISSNSILRFSNIKHQPPSKSGFFSIRGNSNIQTTPNIPSNMNILVYGPPSPGKAEFVEKFINFFSKSSPVVEKSYVNGVIVTSYIFTTEQVEFKLFVADSMVENTTIESNFEKHPRFKSSLKRSNSDSNLNKNHEESTGKRYSTSEIDDPNSILNVEDTKPFSWSEIDWSPDFSDLNGIIFFTNCENFVSNSSMDQPSLVTFERLVGSCHFSDDTSIHGNVPIITLINNSSSKPLLKKKFIRSALSKFFPEKHISQELRSQIFYIPSVVENYISEINNLLLSTVSLFAKYSNINDTVKKISEKKSKSAVFKSNYINKFNDFSPSIFSEILSSHLNVLNLIGQSKIFDSKNLMTILSEMKYSSINYLTISNANFPTECIDVLCDFLETKTSKIVSLKLIQLGLSSENILKIMNSLEDNITLVTLDFSKNTLNYESVYKIIDFSIKSKTLCHLHLSECGLNRNDLKHFEDLFKYSNHLNTLNLSGNKLSIEFFEKLIKTAESNESLPLCNFQCPFSLLQPEFVSRLNVLLSRNRKNISRLFYGEIYFSKEKPTLKELERIIHLLPPSPYTIISLKKILENNKYLFQVEDFEKMVQNSLSIIEKNTPDQIPSEILDYHGTPVSYFFEKGNPIKQTDLIKLDLSWLGLFDKNLQNFQLGLSTNLVSNLKIASLNHNNLVQIPEQITLLPFLEELYLGSNCIEEIKENVKNLSNLVTLDLRGNQIKTVPLYISHLKKLKVLCLQHNHINTIKKNSISELPNLEVLALHNNFLYNFPNDILNKLTNIKEITLKNNFLHPTKCDLLQSWPIKKRSLDLSNSQIEYLPTEICFFHYLVGLNLSENKLETLPPHMRYLTNLKILDLRNNEIEYLPHQMIPILMGISEFFLFGNPIVDQVNFDSPLEKFIPVQKTQINQLVEFIEKKKKATFKRKKIVLGVLYSSEEDYTYFVDVFLNEVVQKSSEQVLAPRMSSTLLFDNNLLKNLYTFPVMEENEKKVTPEKPNSKNDQFIIEEITKKTNSIRRSETNNENKEKEYWFFQTQLNFSQQKIKLEIYGFEDTSHFCNFFNFYNEESDHVFVTISNIYGDVSLLSSMLQSVRNFSKKPLIILGTECSAVEKKQKKDVETLAQKKFSGMYHNISGVYFMSSENSRNFVNMLDNITNKMSKLNTSQLQLHYMIEGEKKLRFLFPIMDYNTFKNLFKETDYETNFMSGIIHLHNTGSAMYFDPTIYGENGLVLLEPHILLSIFRQAKISSYKNGGVFNVSDFYTEILLKHNNLFFSTLWKSMLGLLVKSDSILICNLNRVLNQQLKKNLLKMDFDSMSGRVFIFPSNLEETNISWDLIKDFWNTFEVLDESNFSQPNYNNNVIFQSNTKNIFLNNSNNNTNNNRNSGNNKIHIDNKKSGEHIFINFNFPSNENVSNNNLVINHTFYEMEQWYSILIFSYTFFHRLVAQLIKLKGVKILKLWKNLIICRIFNKTSFAVLIEKGGEDNKTFLKLCVKGTDAPTHFFIICDIIENFANLFLQNRCKISLIQKIFPYTCNGEVSLFKSKMLESALYEGIDIVQCQSCLVKTKRHMIPPSEVTPLLSLNHLSHFKLNDSDLENKVEIARGSCGIVYKGKNILNQLFLIF